MFVEISFITFSLFSLDTLPEFSVILLTQICLFHVCFLLSDIQIPPLRGDGQFFSFSSYWFRLTANAQLRNSGAKFGQIRVEKQADVIFQLSPLAVPTR